MTMLDTRRVTGGVDTHLDVHVAAALDPVGGLLDTKSFEVNPAGYKSLPGSHDVSSYRRVRGPTGGHGYWPTA